LSRGKRENGHSQYSYTKIILEIYDGPERKGRRSEIGKVPQAGGKKKDWSLVKRTGQTENHICEVG